PEVVLFAALQLVDGGERVDVGDLHGAVDAALELAELGFRDPGFGGGRGLTHAATVSCSLQGPADEDAREIGRRRRHGFSVAHTAQETFNRTGFATMPSN
ncbi:hypothetical protein ADL26_07640, partial [Thermoactinomyces vulgaris]